MINNDVTVKNTKAEILHAYELMRKSFEDSQKNVLSPSQENEQKEANKKILEKTANYSSSGLEQDIVSLRKKISISLDETLESLINESNILENVRQAIRIEKSYLEEIRNIKLSDNALQVLISDFESSQKNFEIQRVQVLKNFEDDLTKKKTEWQREQEEYKYNLDTQRKKEENSYLAEKEKEQEEFELNLKKKEQIISEKIENIKKQEQEIGHLRQMAEAFPDELQNSVENAINETERNLKREFEIEKKLLEQDFKANKNILETRINNLEETIKRQMDEIDYLKNALSKANQQAQSLAATVIESVSGAKQANEMVVKEKDQEKN